MNCSPVAGLILFAALALFPAAGAAVEPLPGTAPATGGVASKIGKALTGKADMLAVGAVGLAVSGQAMSPGVSEAPVDYFIILGGGAEQAAGAISDQDSAHGHGSGHGD